MEIQRLFRCLSDKTLVLVYTALTCGSEEAYTDAGAPVGLFICCHVGSVLSVTPAVWEVQYAGRVPDTGRLEAYVVNICLLPEAKT